jgi:O-acetyl-ADP-ribose deacetylase (regulator of RNase III)
VRSSLEQASALGATSVALPAISTGIFGYPKKDGIHCIVDEATRWLRAHPASSVSTLRFVAVDAATAELFAAELAQ